MVAAKGHEIPPGVGSGKLHGRRVRRGPVLGELDLVGSFDDPENLLGTFNLDRAGPREIRSELQLTPNGVENWRIGVAEGHRPEAHPVLDEFVAVHVPDMAAEAPLDERRSQLGKLVVSLGVGVTSTGNEPVADELELLAFNKFQSKPSFSKTGHLH